MNYPIETHQFLTSWKDNLSESLLQNFSNNWLDKKEAGYFGFIPENMTALFLGTFPVPEQRTNGFFYHSERNQFWKILSEITGCNLDKPEKKLPWLCDLKIGITDILCEIQRTDENCTSSADSDLKVILFNNISNLIADFPLLSDIFLTSGGPSVKSLSGKSAGGWLGLHLRETGCKIKKVSSDGATLKIKILPDNRDLNLHYLITPAPRDTQILKYFLDNENNRNSLDQLNIFQNITNKTEQYKVIQWATYLSKIPGVVSEKIRMEIENRNLKNLLIENQ